MNRHPVCASVLVAVALTANASISPISAQGRLVGGRTSAAGVTYEVWNVGNGIVEPAVDGTDSVRVRRVSQMSIPITLVFPVGSRWMVDVATGYTHGNVALNRSDSAIGRSQYELRGITDVRVRAVGGIVADRVTLTFGANLPTGATGLNAEEWAAARLLAAPALGFTTPLLGAGGSATAGIVVARPIAGWAWAAAASYEYRRSYSPVSLIAGIPSPEFSPSDAVHLSLGGDRLLGQSRLTLSASADVFGNDRLSSGDATSSGIDTGLGPIYTGELQFQVGTRWARDLTVYAVDRYRSSYKRSGEVVTGSDGNYLDVGARTLVPLASHPSMAISGGINVRHQTGLGSDRTLPTAGYRGVAGVLGAAKTVGGVYSIQPFIRAQLGTIETAGRSSSARFVGAGVTLGRQF